MAERYRMLYTSGGELIHECILYNNVHFIKHRLLAYQPSQVSEQDIRKITITKNMYICKLIYIQIIECSVHIKTTQATDSLQ